MFASVTPLVLDDTAVLAQQLHGTIIAATWGRRQTRKLASTSPPRLRIPQVDRSGRQSISAGAEREAALGGRCGSAAQIVVVREACV